MAKGGFLDVQVPMFVPVWRRVLAVTVLTLWTAVEVASGEWIWAALFGGASVYLAHQFFFAWDPPEEDR